jgi:hypothetical protein
MIDAIALRARRLDRGSFDAAIAGDRRAASDIGSPFASPPIPNTNMPSIQHGDRARDFAELWATRAWGLSRVQRYFNRHPHRRSDSTGSGDTANVIIASGPPLTIVSGWNTLGGTMRDGC